MVCLRIDLFSGRLHLGAVELRVKSGPDNRVRIDDPSVFILFHSLLPHLTLSHSITLSITHLHSPDLTAYWGLLNFLQESSLWRIWPVKGTVRESEGEWGRVERRGMEWKLMANQVPSVFTCCHPTPHHFISSHSYFKFQWSEMEWIGVEQNMRIPRIVSISNNGLCPENLQRGSLDKLYLRTPFTHDHWLSHFSTFIPTYHPPLLIAIHHHWSSFLITGDEGWYSVMMSEGQLSCVMSITDD